MKTSITARHFTASQRLQEYAEEAISKLEKFYDGNMECDVIFEEDPDFDNPQKVELQLRVVKATLVATEKAPSYEQAINLAVENLKRQLLRHKKKNLSHA